MLFFTRWKAAAILLTAFVVCLCAVPNFFPESTVKHWPAWAQRHIVLGLDLQGGSHLLLQVDSSAVRKERLQSLNDDVLRVLRQARIQFTGRAIVGNGVQVHITRDTDMDNALAKLRELSTPLSGILGTSGQRSIDVTANAGVITLTPTDAALTERIRQAVDQSIQIIERRVNELGLVEPTIQREGIDRILVQVPGLQDPSRLKEIHRQDREARFPHGRSVDAGGAGGAIAAAGGLRGSRRRGRREISDRETRAGLRRRPDRRPAGFRPAHQRADRQLPLQFVGRAQIRRGDADQCRQAVRHRARQQGDLGAGDPRADPRRLRADFREFHRSVGQRSRHPAARRRAAGAADHHRGAHGRARPRPGLRSRPASTPLMPARRSSSSSCSRPTGCSGCSPISRSR